MSYAEIILLAIALSIDACIVSFSYGLLLKNNRLKYSLALALFTGVFQGLMPLVSYYLTNFVKSYVAPFASLIVFLIFTYLGVKFIIEACHKQKEKVLCIGLSCLLIIGIATSIDAFSAGISLSLYGNRIFKPVILITGITFLNSLSGFWLGGKMQKISTKYLEIFAGFILIFLGLKALF